MTLLTQTQELKELWGLLFPAVVAPEESQLTLWLVRHDTAIVRKGISELAVKFRRVHGQMDPVWMAKFASSVMNRLSGEQSARGKVANGGSK